MKFINSFKEGDRVQGVYFCKSKAILQTKAGKDYFNVMLKDKSATMDTKIWEVTSSGIEDFDTGDYIYIEGEVVSYNNQLQLKAHRVRKAESDEYDKNDFVESSTKDIKDMEKELDSLIVSVKHKGYNKLLNEIFVDDKNFRKVFVDGSAAKTVHHAFLHGLLEHTLSVAKMAKAMAENYTDVNVDLVVTASLLHDIGKTKELSELPQSEYTDCGQLIGHIVMGYEMIKRHADEIKEISDREKNELYHCILSHHGSLEFGSPRTPMLMEAFIVSSADNVDAKLETMRENFQNAKVTNKKDKEGFMYDNFIKGNIRETTKVNN
ncbi:MAG: HD domain-containing protein [Lachnospiraceae bacterium]|nr:HD domain-containing protein [Lachnospiraceae bacterium]